MFQREKVFKLLVTEINRTIGEQVIFTNEAGVIVASTVENRIGQFHEGARQAMQCKTYLYMTEDKVKELIGVRKGVVTPIFIEQEPIGVVGITGNPESIKKFILIVQRMAELFIKNISDQLAVESFSRNIELFVFDWLTESLDEKQIAEYSDFYQVNLTQFKRIILCEVESVKELTTEQMERLRLNWYEEALFIRWGQGKFIIVTQSAPQDQLKKKLHHFQKNITTYFQSEIFIGVGQEVLNVKEMSNSLRQAELALQLATHHRSIVFEEYLLLEKVQYHLVSDVKSEFINRTLAPLKKDDVLIYTLEKWFQYNMKAEQTADSLHIHKNTLYYRLNKISTLTGLNIQDIDDIVLLYLALQFNKNRS